MPPFHWSKIPPKNSPLRLSLHLKTPTQEEDLTEDEEVAAEAAEDDVEGGDEEGSTMDLSDFMKEILPENFDLKV